MFEKRNRKGFNAMISIQKKVCDSRTLVCGRDAIMRKHVMKSGETKEMVI